MSKTNLITAERLREVLHYDRETGEFRWTKPPCPRDHAGDLAGRVNRNGIRLIGLDGVAHSAARLAILLSTGVMPEGVVTYRDGDKSNLALDNLMVIHRSEMTHCARPQRNSKSGVAGVFYVPKRKRWRAAITVGRKAIQREFRTKAEAVAARRQLEGVFRFRAG